MRVPGTLNTKESNNFRMAEVVDDLSTNTPIENIGAFPKEIFNLSSEDKTKAQNHLNKLDGKLQINIHQDVNIDEVPDSFISLMEKDQNIHQLFNNPVEYYGDRSAADRKLANILFNKNIPLIKFLTFILFISLGVLLVLTRVL